MNRNFPLSQKFLLKTLSAMLGASLLITAPVGSLSTVHAASDTSQAEVEAWQTNKAYSAGDIVSHQGKIYQAKWWSYNSRPDAKVTNEWDTPWKLLSDSGKDTTPPTSPTQLVSTEQTSTSITLSWTASTDNVAVSHYDVYRNGSRVGSTIAKMFTDYELKADTLYQYMIRAVDTSGNEAGSTTIHASTKAVAGSDLQVGESRVLSDAQITQLWNGLNPAFLPDAAAAAIQTALPKAEYESTFPLRYGTAEWDAIAKGKYYYKPNQSDYYSYDNLVAAVREMANIKYKEVIRQGNSNVKQIYRLDKHLKTETLLYQAPDFNDANMANLPKITRIVDFGSFLSEGSSNDRKRELAGFLANIAHETGGGWSTAPGGELRWALFFNEELNYVNTDNIGYVDEDNLFWKPVAGKSYHGRGPIQLSWNYNYGLISSIVYSDPSILLNDPDKITADGKLGYITALLFWMTPQDPKPSNHDIMIGQWVPTTEQLAKGLVPGFGATIMVINGGQEGNLSEEMMPVKRRVDHYRDLTTRMGATITGEKLDTAGMQPF
ncbi:glycoside hydrolase family 19 protein [Paenibacillus aquistagni]|uniref:Carbohydrate binding domain-containing protein n=1 Tax=Paenibacillus aquistagni TaxID=1852522 RepID=A0A1X7ILJ4_9BACL|nr:glycoside hydrolase family 19 protein [Paenibacillus aquistagni]SMG15738.1 Carbohydrate binding domain-containing protein [Paenibacillus aquistagni]